MYPRRVPASVTRAVTASVAAAALAGVTGAALAGGAAPPGRTPLDAHRSLGAPRTFRNLSLIPVYDSSPAPAGHYLTLDEGLRTKQVIVEEAAGGGQVNQLFITNTGARPLYVMAGEVVLGGQQDRTLASDTIVPPGKQKVPVTVFCVEHGRWSGQRAFEGSAPALASADIRAEVQNGAFAESRPAPAGTARPEVAAQHVAGRREQAQNAVQPSRVGEAQGRVWQKVAEKNSRFKAAPATGTYRGLLTLSEGEAQKEIAPYLEALRDGPGRDPHLVGVVAGINGEVAAADIFNDPALFRALWPKLLRSYAASAAESAGKQQASRPVTALQAKAFIQSGKDGTRAENHSDVATTLRLESKKTLVYRLTPKPAAAGMFGGGGFGGGAAVHENVLKK